MNNCTLNVLLNMKKYKLEKIDKEQWRFYDSDNTVNLLLTNENAKKVYLNSYNEKIKKIANETGRLDNIREELELKRAEDIRRAKEREKKELQKVNKLIRKSDKIKQELKNIPYDENKPIVCVGVVQKLGMIKNNSATSNEIFVVRQKRDKKWMLPGGMLENSLTDQEGVFSGLSREILEETGLDINNKNYYTKFIDYKYFKTKKQYNDKPLYACVVHMLVVEFPQIDKLFKLFETRTQLQNPPETDKWGFYNISSKNIRVIETNSKSKTLRQVIVKNPKYRSDFQKNLSKVIDSCNKINTGIF